MNSAAAVHAHMRARAESLLAQPPVMAARDPDCAELPLWLALNCPPAARADTAKLVARLARRIPACAAAAAQARARLAFPARGAHVRLARRAAPLAAGLLLALLGASPAPAGRAPRRDRALLPAPARPGLAPLPAADLAIGAPLAPTFHERGFASWYGPRFHGRQAADGTIYDQEALTCAHRTLRLGTWLRVSRELKDGGRRSVLVQVTDRGPYAQIDRRVIDLSRGAARELGMLDSGLAPVTLEIVVPREKNVLHFGRAKR